MTQMAVAKALCIAARQGDATLVKTYLDSGVGQRYLDSGAPTFHDAGPPVHFPPLKHAAVGGHLHVMDLLLRYGADIDGVGSDGLGALHFAAVTFQLEALQFLLDKGARVSVTATDGRTPLMGTLSMFLPSCVMDARKLAVVEALLTAGAAVYGHSERRMSALARVVRAPNFSIPPSFQLRAFNLLVEYGGDIEEQDSDGKTPLHYAAQANNFAMVLRLLELGAGIRTATRVGQTALGYAQRKRAWWDALSMLHKLQAAHEDQEHDTRVETLLYDVDRLSTDYPKMHALLMGGVIKHGAASSAHNLTPDLVRHIFGVKKPETAYEREIEALVALQLRRPHAGV